MLLITRPLPKLQASADAFEQAGINAVGVATSDIQSIPSKANELQQFLLSSPSVNSIIVTSIYAVPATLDALNHVSLLSAPTTLIAVGDATADRKSVV